MVTLFIAYIAMIAAVSSANYLVQFPINNWLTWGVPFYPITYLITELTNRFHGPQAARRVVYVGFVLAVVFSTLLATPKIALASGTAFLVGQLLDISVFNRFRQADWWQAPLFASLLATTVDNTLFWTIAFWNEPAFMLTWAIGEGFLKIAIDLALLTPFRLLVKTNLFVRI